MVGSILIAVFVLGAVAALGLWLRGALTGEPFDTKAALRVANDYIDLLLEARAKARSGESAR